MDREVKMMTEEEGREEESKRNKVGRKEGRNRRSK
jgi:hypothetical protein